MSNKRKSMSMVHSRLWSRVLADANEKYFWSSPFWSQGICLDQSTERTVMYMDETAVRARAGIIHIIVWLTLLSSVTIPQYMVIVYVGPFIIYDMISGSIFGLTPFCPLGVIGTIIAWNLKPFYKPSAPKRFAWMLGACMATLCMIVRLTLGAHFTIKFIMSICILLTFMEASLGFCLGCWLYAQIKNLRDRFTAISKDHNVINDDYDNQKVSASVSDDSDDGSDDGGVCSIEINSVTGQQGICGS